MAGPKERIKKRKMDQEDFEFLMGSELVQAAPDEARSQLMAALAPIRVKAGERFIRQGDEGSSVYLVQHGSCIVSLEKDGLVHPLTRLKSGDLVGEMAILTGEQRSAHVDAETDMALWRISGLELDEICLEFPDLREFLTEVVTHRFSRSKFTADRTIGKYVITDVIGQGGWSIVYKGTHSYLNMPVAIKMMKHNMAMDPDFLAKFQNEAKIIARFNHENIVRVYDIEHLYRTVFIVMEYLDGVSLEYILERQPTIPFESVLDFLVQVSRGLSYAHEQGIVHQDIKPANIFIQEGERAKIVDFGLACPTGSEDEIGLAGTPYYMSPEQIEGDPVDERTDIYAFGITAFELATSQRPFGGKDLAKVMTAHREEPVPDPRSLNPDLPAEFNDFVQRATRKDPGDRYQDMKQVLDDLNALAERTGVTPSVAESRRAKMMSLFMFYDDEHDVELTHLVENFTQELERLGVVLRAAEFHDLAVVPPARSED